MATDKFLKVQSCSRYKQSEHMLDFSDSLVNEGLVDVTANSKGSPGPPGAGLRQTQMRVAWPGGWSRERCLHSRLIGGSIHVADLPSGKGTCQAAPETPVLAQASEPVTAFPDGRVHRGSAAGAGRGGPAPHLPTCVTSSPPCAPVSPPRTGGRNGCLLRLLWPKRRRECRQ